MSPIYVVVKAEYTRYEQAIRDLLARLGYTILEKKQITLSRDQAITFLSTIDEGARQNSFEQYLDEWQSGISKEIFFKLLEILLLHLNKPAGRKEMLSLLSNIVVPLIRL